MDKGPHGETQTRLAVPAGGFEKQREGTERVAEGVPLAVPAGSGAEPKAVSV